MLDKQHLRMWLIYPFTAVQCNSEDKDIQDYARKVIKKSGKVEILQT